MHLMGYFSQCYTKLSQHFMPANSLPAMQADAAYIMTRSVMTIAICASVVAKCQQFSER